MWVILTNRSTRMNMLLLICVILCRGTFYQFRLRFHRLTLGFHTLTFVSKTTGALLHTAGGLLVQHLFLVTDRFNSAQEGGVSRWTKAQSPSASFNRSPKYISDLQWKGSLEWTAMVKNGSLCQIKLLSLFLALCFTLRCVFSGQNTLTFGLWSKTVDPDKLCYREEQGQKEEQEKWWCGASETRIFIVLVYLCLNYPYLKAQIWGCRIYFLSVRILSSAGHHFFEE